jgi:hypothetical protein
LSGDAFDEGVGHDLVARTGIARGDHGIGVPAQRGQARHSLLDRQQAAEHAHRVGCRTQPDPAVLPRGAAPRHVGGAIGFVGQPACHRFRPASRQLFDAGGADLLVDQAAVFGVEVASLGYHRGGDVLADPPGRQQTAYAGQVEVQGAGDAQAARAVERGDAAGQPDLIADAAADGSGVEPVVDDLGLDLGSGERDHLRLLCGRDRATQPLEQRDAIDPVGVRTGKRVGSEGAEPGQHCGDLGRERIRHLSGRIRSHV